MVVWQISNKQLHLFFVDSLPLEAYHMPRFFVRSLKWAPHLKISEKTLKERAERRAAKLRAQMGIAIGAPAGPPRAAELSA